MAVGGAIVALVSVIIGMVLWGSILIAAGVKTLQFVKDVEGESNENEKYLQRWTRFVAIMAILAGVATIFATFPTAAATFVAASRN